MEGGGQCPYLMSGSTTIMSCRRCLASNPPPVLALHRPSQRARPNSPMYPSKNCSIGSTLTGTGAPPRPRLTVWPRGSGRAPHRPHRPPVQDLSPVASWASAHPALHWRDWLMPPPPTGGWAGRGGAGWLGGWRAGRRRDPWCPPARLPPLAKLPPRRPADRTPPAAPGEFPSQLSEFIADEVA